MARYRRLHRDPGGLLVAHLADEQDVRVGAEHRAQAAREGETGARVHLDLVHAGDLVLDGILDRGEGARLVVRNSRAA